jgi:hypothetical protein
MVYSETCGTLFGAAFIYSEIWYHRAQKTCSDFIEDVDMTDATKARLLRFGSSSCMFIGFLSIPFSIMYSYPISVGLVIGMVGSVLCLSLLVKVELRLPRKQPTRELPVGILSAPGLDSVTLPQFHELWRSLVTMLSIVSIPILALVYHFGTDYQHRDWLPYIIATLVFVFVHESIWGPNRRWWIANVIGEWSFQPWSTSTTAHISYLVDTRQYNDHVTQRAFAFFGKVLFRRYWLEVYFPEQGLVGYVPVDKTLYEIIQSYQKQTVLVEARFSTLHPKRMQLRLAS